MIVGGLSLLAAVGWREWGTGVQTARAQETLRVQLDQAFPAHPIPGGALGLLSIPRIQLDMAFVQGVAGADLAKGPGHYPGTALPGHAGNVAIAGHRTTHGAPFWSLDRIRPGDGITIQTHAGTFVYRVAWVRTVASTAWWITERTDRPSLTLSTCTPRYTSRDRLVVRAIEVSDLPARVRGSSIPRPARPVLT